MMKHIVLTVVVALLLVSPARGQESFTRGHIFVSVFESEPCDHGGMGREWVIEIDPNTGATSVFVD